MKCSITTSPLVSTVLYVAVLSLLLTQTVSDHGKKTRSFSEKERSFFGDDEEEKKSWSKTDDMFGHPYGEYYADYDRESANTKCDKYGISKELETQKRKYSLLREELIQCKVQQKQRHSGRFTVMLQLIKSLLTPLSKMKDEEPPSTTFTLSLSIEDRLKLENISKAKLPSTIEVLETFEILKTVLERGNASTDIYLSTSSFDTQTLLQFSAVGICLVLAVFVLTQMRQGFSWRGLVIWIFCGAFLVSIPWEWYRMYRREIAKKLAQGMTSDQEKCYPKKLSTFQSIKMWFEYSFTFKDDECMKYHESVLVDPFWEVSPLQAFATSLTNFIVSPLTIVMDAFVKSFRVLMMDLPVQWQPLVFMALIFLLTVVILSLCAFEINLPFMQFAVRGRSNNSEVKRLEKEVEQLQVILKQLRENNKNTTANRGDVVESIGAAGLEGSRRITHAEDSERVARTEDSERVARAEDSESVTRAEDSERGTRAENSERVTSAEDQERTQERIPKEHSDFCDINTSSSPDGYIIVGSALHEARGDRSPAQETGQETFDLQSSF